MRLLQESYGTIRKKKTSNDTWHLPFHYKVSLSQMNGKNKQQNSSAHYRLDHDGGKLISYALPQSLVTDYTSILFHAYIRWLKYFYLQKLGYMSQNSLM